jgi:hypothetical protein
MTEAKGTPIVGFGVAMGAGIGLTVGVVVGGGPGIALGAAVGAGLGVVVGAVWQALAPHDGARRGG